MNIGKSSTVAYNAIMLSLTIFILSAFIPLMARDAIAQGVVTPDPTSITSQTIMDLSKKDPLNVISYLSLTVAIGALGFSTYLIKRVLDDKDKDRAETREQTKAIDELTAEIRDNNTINKQIADKIKGQPCALESETLRLMLRGKFKE